MIEDSVAALLDRNGGVVERVGRLTIRWRTPEEYERIRKRRPSARPFKVLDFERTPEEAAEMEQREKEERKETRKVSDTRFFYTPPPVLGRIVGDEKMSVSLVFRRLMGYVKENKLMGDDVIHCDAILSEALGGVDTVKPREVLSLAMRDNPDYVASDWHLNPKYSLPSRFQDPELKLGKRSLKERLERRNARLQAV